jgi:hypothetical protein
VYPSGAPGFTYGFLVGSVLLILLVFCVLLCVFFVYLRSVSCVPNVASVSGLSILDRPFGFLETFINISTGKTTNGRQLYYMFFISLYHHVTAGLLLR